MGLIKGGEIVRNVFFSKNKARYNGNHHDQAQERRKWSKMRSYLCGDEFNSVLAEHDSDSFRSYSAVDPLQNSGEEAAAVIMDSIQQPVSAEKQSSTADLFRQEDAAIAIQIAFRNFRASRRRRTELEMIEAEESIATSLEVQTGQSVEIFTAKKLQLKSRTFNSSKVKEDWDDSTVSSNISKMRIQNRVEAMTRRERALAYAFSQQLRLCSKKKHTNNNPDMAWTWLERWMATRLPEISYTNYSTVESHNGNRDQSLMRKRLLDITIEEKESCGSNEVSSILQNDQNITKNRVKPPRTVSRKKVSKKDSPEKKKEVNGIED